MLHKVMLWDVMLGPLLIKGYPSVPDTKVGDPELDRGSVQNLGLIFGILGAIWLFSIVYIQRQEPYYRRATPLEAGNIILEDQIEKNRSRKNFQLSGDSCERK